MIRLEGVSKRFGRVVALDGLSVDIPAGRVTALVGPNAAGKTTLVKAVLGLVHIDSGGILIDGTPISRDPVYRERIGYMPQHPAFPDNLRVRELFAFIDDLRGVRPGDGDGPFDRAPGRRLVEAFDLELSLDKRLGTLSGGTRQKVNAAIGFRYAPDLLILDEPTAGLDPLARTRLKAAIRVERDRGTTVLVTSHVLSELRDLADHVVYLVDGRARVASSVADLLRRTGATDLEGAVAALMASGTAEPDAGVVGGA